VRPGTLVLFVCPIESLIRLAKRRMIAALTPDFQKKYLKNSKEKAGFSAGTWQPPGSL
jgi:hypothetical protein